MYYLSELGQNQLASNSRQLSLYERRLLRHVAQGQSPEEIRAYVGVGDVSETLYVLAKNGYLSKDPPASAKPASAPASSLLRNGIAGVLKEVSTAIGKTAAEISTLPPIFSSPEKTPPPAAFKHHETSTAPPTMAEKPNLVLASNNEAPKTPAAVPATELHPELRQRLVAIVQESGARHLGLFSRDIIALCEHAKTLDAMQTGISRWHIALLESKTGKDHAFDYLQQINALLLSENRPQAASA
jgi:hypothetical protein